MALWLLGIVWHPLAGQGTGFEQPRFLWTRSQHADSLWQMPRGIVGSLRDTLVVVADVLRPAVVVLNAETGELVRTVGRAGDGPGEFRAPELIAFDDQTFAVLDVGRQSIELFDRRWTFVHRAPVGPTVVFPKALALYGDSLLLLTGGSFGTFREIQGAHWLRRAGSAIEWSTLPNPPAGADDHGRHLLAGGPVMLLHGQMLVADAASGDVWRTASGETGERLALGPQRPSDLTSRMLRPVDHGRGPGMRPWWTFPRPVLLDTLADGRFLLAMSRFDNQVLEFFALAPGQSPTALATLKLQVTFAAPYDRTSFLVVGEHLGGAMYVGRLAYPEAVRKLR